MDVKGSSKMKEKKGARGYEGDEVLKSGSRVLVDSQDEGWVAMISIEALRPLLQATGVSSEVQPAFAPVVPSPFKGSSPLRIQSPHIPQRISIETSTRLYRTRSYETRGTGKDSAFVDELGDQGVDESLALWTLCYIRNYHHWFCRYRPSKMFRYSELERAGWEGLWAMLGLAAPKGPERTVPAQLSPQGSSKGSDNATWGTELASSSSLVPNVAPSIEDPPTHL